jgi:hypothetical protein
MDRQLGFESWALGFPVKGLRLLSNWGVEVLMVLFAFTALGTLVIGVTVGRMLSSLAE